MLLSLSFIVGCGSGDTMTNEDVKKLELFRGVKPSMGDDKEYNLYAFFEFYDGSSDAEAISEGVRQRDKYDELQETLEMDNVNQLTIKTNSLNSEEIEILGIKKLPTFLVLDESRIVFQSTDLDEVVSLINGDK